MKYIYIPAIIASLVTGCSSKEHVKPVVKETFALSDTMLKKISVAEVTLQPLTNELRFYGKISVDNTKMVEVYPMVGGNVLEVFAGTGDAVTKGQTLATIRSSEVAGFDKDLQDAINDVQIAKKNLQVSEELYQGKLNSELDVIQARGQLSKAQAQLRRINETLKIYHVKPGSVYEVRSPLNGFVIEKNINADMQLRSDRTDNIFDIAQIDEVWAIANVNESDIQMVDKGMDAYVTTISYPDKVFTGKVEKIYNIIDPDTKAMKFRVPLKNTDMLLKPEMRASIVVKSKAEDRSMLSIPANALIFDKGRNFVMIFHDRYNVETRPVEVFRQVGDVVYINSGLQKGEKVINKNQLLIYDALND